MRHTFFHIWLASDHSYTIFFPIFLCFPTEVEACHVYIPGFPVTDYLFPLVSWCTCVSLWSRTRDMLLAREYWPNHLGENFLKAYIENICTEKKENSVDEDKIRQPILHSNSSKKKIRRYRWHRVNNTMVTTFAAGVVDTGSNFATGVVDTCGAPWLANSCANFRKNWKWPYCYFQGLGQRWFMKKTWSKKSRDTVPLRLWVHARPQIFSIWLWMCVSWRKLDCWRIMLWERSCVYVRVYMQYLFIKATK